VCDRQLAVCGACAVSVLTDIIETRAFAHIRMQIAWCLLAPAASMICLMQVLTHHQQCLYGRMGCTLKLSVDG
jgi:hypothetical protein